MAETAAPARADTPPPEARPSEVPETNPLARLAELLLAAGVVALGAVMALQTGDIRVPRSAATVGPRVIPYVVAGGLIVAGCWLAVDVLRGRTGGAGEAGEDVDLSLPADWRCVGTIGVALLAYLLLIERAGFVLASAALFVGAAYGMGSRRVLRDVALGLVLATLTYLIFTRALELRLPSGWLGGVV